MSNLNVHTHVRVAGRYRIRVLREDGSVRKEVDWFDNLITNQGLDRLGASVQDYNVGASSYCNNTRCAVGTSSTVPSNTDTTLGAQLYAYPAWGTAGVQPTMTGSYVSGPPAYLTSSYTYVFPLGAFSGNIAEIGVGIYPTGSTSGSSVSLFSHALIMSGGSPTTISVTTSDQLEVTFELRWYVNTTVSSPYTVTIAGVNYTITSNSQVGGTGISNMILNGQIDATSPSTGSSVICYVFNGTIGSVTAGPSGTSAYLGTAPLPSYTAGTYTKSYTFSANTTQGNVPGGITAFNFVPLPQGWQFSCSPAIPKTSSYTMSLTFSVSWNRYP